VNISAAEEALIYSKRRNTALEVLNSFQQNENFHFKEVYFKYEVASSEDFRLLLLKKAALYLKSEENENFLDNLDVLVIRFSCITNLIFYASIFAQSYIEKQNNETLKFPKKNDLFHNLKIERKNETIQPFFYLFRLEIENYLQTLKSNKAWDVELENLEKEFVIFHFFEKFYNFEKIKHIFENFLQNY
jgi:hypothetical protein